MTEQIDSLFRELVEVVGPQYVSQQLSDRIAYSKDYSIEGLSLIHISEPTRPY